MIKNHERCKDEWQVKKNAVDGWMQYDYTCMATHIYIYIQAEKKEGCEMSTDGWMDEHISWSQSYNISKRGSKPVWDEEKGLWPVEMMIPLSNLKMSINTSSLHRLKRTLLLSLAPHLVERRPRRSGLLRRSRTRPTTWLSSTSPLTNVCSRKFLPTSSSPNLSWLIVSSWTVPWLVLLFVSSNLKVWSSLSLATTLKLSTVSCLLLSLLIYTNITLTIARATGDEK